MRKYYKAYYLKDLRQFSGWAEKHGENEATPSDDTICYLGDDFIVVNNPVQVGEPLFSDVTSAWQSFCATTLQFEVPEDVRTSYPSGEGQRDTETATV